MRKISELSLRRTFLLLTTAVAAVGVFVGLPVKKAVAATENSRMAPAGVVNQPTAQLLVVQPERINPSTLGLLKVADAALSNDALAERIFEQSGRGGVAVPSFENRDSRLAPNDPRRSFRLRATTPPGSWRRRQPYARSMHMPAFATNARLITERMIVGRAILAAVGRSYLNAANAHDCCPWNKAIELGLSGDPAFYNAVFVRPAGANLSQPGTMRP